MRYLLVLVGIPLVLSGSVILGYGLNRMRWLTESRFRTYCFTGTALILTGIIAIMNGTKHG